MKDNDYKQGFIGLLMIPILAIGFIIGFCYFSLKCGILMSYSAIMGE